MNKHKRVITFRVTPSQGEKIDRMVAQANARAKINGLDEDVTISSIFRDFVDSLEETSLETEGVQVKAASSLHSAKAKLRGK